MQLLTRVYHSCLAVALVCAVMTVSRAASADGGTVTGDKTVASQDISCDGSTQVTLTLHGTSGIAGDPVDIELVLDRSGSMAGVPIAALKTAAKAFVDIIDEATDGALDGVVANGSRIGVVSFADAATMDVLLTTDANAVKAAIDALVAGGLTNHAAAIARAQLELTGTAPSSSDLMIVFTDGMTTAGADPDSVADAARAAGTEIFAIGLGSVDGSQLEDWASDPDAEHVFITPDASTLQAIFEEIGAAITTPAATEITVVETVAPGESVSSVSASKGSVAQAGNVLTWAIDELATETVTLTFTVTHSAAAPGGVFAVNASAVYSDAEGHVVTFPSPSVNVHGCPAAIDLTPPTADNELGTPGQEHTVTALVTDDFGDPVASVAVEVLIFSGPNAGAAAAGPTDVAGELDFAYSATQGPAGLGQDVILACFTGGDGAQICDDAVKNWVDTTPPVVTCVAGTNPSGQNVPPAGGNPQSGQNPDGFYLLTATDSVDPDVDIFVADNASSFVAGPFDDGDQVKITQVPGGNPTSQPMAGVIVAHIKLNGDALLYATDASGNTSTPILCLVPPPPK